MADAESAEVRERNKHNAVMQAYADKMESAAETEEESSDEEEDVQAYTKPRGFRRMMSSMMGASTTILSRTPSTTKTYGDLEADMEDGDAGDADDGAMAMATVAPKRKKKKKVVRVHIITQSPEEEAIRLRRVFLTRLKGLVAKGKLHVGQVRKDAAIVNLNAQVLAEERSTTVSKLRVLSLTLVKIGTLVNMTEEEVETAVSETERAEEMVASVLANTGGTDEQAQAMLTAVTILDEVAETVGSPAERDYFSNASEVMDWELGDPELNKLAHDVERELETNDQRKAAMDQKVMLATTNFVSAVNVTKVAQRNNFCSRWLFTLWGLVLPRVFLIYPVFYSVFFGGMAAAGLPMFFKISAVETNDEMQASGLLGKTFLPVPGYYNLEERTEQRYWVPIIYTLMHSALYCFCWIPVPFFRGIWRDVSIIFPSSRKFIPIDDLVFFHKLLAVFLLSFLFLGAGVWLYVLYIPCLDGDARTCQAFDPLPPPDVADENGTFAYNPFLNVLMLRKVRTHLHGTYWFLIHLFAHSVN